VDNLCHSLVGAALAETGLRRRTRYATATLVLGANFPDVDIAAAFTEHGLGFRRGITHGLLALVVLPFVLTGLMVAWARLRGQLHAEVRPRQVFLLAAIAIATHPLLDWMNVYGMRWLMPFDGTWFYGDALFIIDPWLWLLLGTAWGAGRLWRGRGGAGPRNGERLARGLVGLSAVYVAGMLAVSIMGRGVARRSLGLASAPPRVLMVAPPFLASWRRDVTVALDGVYRFGRIDWRPAPGVELYPGGVTPNLGLLDGTPTTVPLADLLDWARFPFATPDGELIYVDDARYAHAGRSFAGLLIGLGGGPALTPGPRSPP
jgi:inner membrane protein